MALPPISSRASIDSLVRVPLEKIPSMMPASLQALFADRVACHSLAIARFENRHLSPLDSWKEKIVTKIAAGASYLYIDQDMGERMAQLIMRNLQNGDYHSCENPFSFKEAVLGDLRSVCPDKHLDLELSREAISPHEPWRCLRDLRDEELTPEQIAYNKSLISENLSDFSKDVESRILPGTDIGYFRIDSFPNIIDFPENLEVIDAAMQKVVGAKALIIDLRENGGGRPEAVEYVANYLFDDRQLINELYTRSSDETTSYYADPGKIKAKSKEVFGGTRPIYVLTSDRTFSAGEELAYDLQAAGRAVVIGQTTGGGAHPVRHYVLDDHFVAVIPYAKAINPHTHGNWEGVGVIPDHPIEETADAGLARAIALIQS